MSNFSDREDRDLVRLAKGYEDEGVNVSWTQVAQRMKYSKKTALVLKQRLTTLKRTHGRLLRDFPAWFRQCQPRTYQPQRVERVIRLCELQPRPTSPQPHVLLPVLPTTAPQAPVFAPPVLEPKPVYSLQSFNELLDSHVTIDTHGASKREAVPGSSRLTVAPPLSMVSTYAAVTHIFASVRQSDVRQSSGRAEQNVGELSVLGVDTLIEACQFTPSDTFLDVGSGIGNVVAQVALQTQVKLAVGLEVRACVASMGQDLIAVRQAGDLSQLKKSKIIVGDIRTTDTASFANATVLYSNNLLFTPSSNLAIHRVCCTLKSLRLVLLADPACHRHSARCTTEFCAIWDLSNDNVQVGTEFRSALMRLYVYKRKK